MRRKLMCIVVLVMSAVLLTGCLYNPNPIELRNILKDGTERYEREQAIGDGELPATPEEHVATWSEYYWPEELPEGYELTDAQGFGEKIATFTSEDGKTEVTISQENTLFATGEYSDDATVSEIELEKAEFDGWSGHVYIYKSGERIRLIVQKDLILMMYDMTGNVDKEDLLQIAESMKWNE